MCSKMYLFVLLLVVPNYMNRISLGTAEDVLVNTNYGPVRGSTRQINLTSPANRNSLQGTATIDVFFGIPFAKPPVGALSYEKPQPPAHFSGVFNASTQPKMCVWEYGIKGLDWPSLMSEDCLYLSIYRPHRAGPSFNPHGLPSSSHGKKLPVMVLVHGGAYVISGPGPHGYYNLTELGGKYVAQDMILVVIQYRLGFLGFASNGQSDFAGNLGLWDQTAALQYVHDNIAHFGGDPNRVTVYGISAGSSSVSALTLSPHSRDLFKQAVQQSGSVFAHWTSDARVIDSTAQLTSLLNCTGGNATSAMKSCLRNHTIDQIYAAMAIMTPVAPYDLNFVNFVPHVDGDFLPSDYPTLIQQAPPKPSIIGVEQSDALVFSLMGVANSTIFSYYVPAGEYPTFGPADIQREVQALFNAEPLKALGANRTAQLQSSITAFYSNVSNNQSGQGYTGTALYLERYAQLLSDMLWVVPALMEAQLKVQANWCDVYFYRNQYFNNVTVAPANSLNPVWQSTHGNVHTYLMSDYAIPNGPWNSADDAERAFWVGVLVNFVKEGKPTKNNSWQPNSVALPSRGMQIELPNASPVMVNSMAQDVYAFWQGIFAAYAPYNPMRGSA